MSNNSIDFLADSLGAPLGELISSIGKGVGEAQAALDEGSLQQTLALYQEEGNEEGVVGLLQQIGYQPTFYTIPEVKVKAKVSLAITQSRQESGPNTRFPTKTRMYTTPVNATFVNKYNANIEASAEIEFTIKPIPPLVEARVTPKLEGMVLEDAIEKLTLLGLSYRLEEGDEEELLQKTIKKQAPAPGVPVKVGDTILLSF